MKLEIKHASSVPIYLQVKNQIKSFILENNLKHGTLLPDLKTIAASADVGVKTAYKGIEELIEEGVCFRRPKKGTYVGKVKEPVKKQICGIWHRRGEQVLMNDMISTIVYRGISEGAEQHKMDTFFISGDISESVKFYRMIDEIQLQGIIMLCSEKLSDCIKLAESFPNLKFIYINNFFEGFEHTPDNVYGLFNDDFTGAYQMTEYLISRGHRHIGMITMKVNDNNYRFRVDGYCQALRDHNLPVHQDLIIENQAGPGETDEQKQIGQKYTKTLLTRNKDISAIFCVNDYLALGVATYLDSLNIRNKVEVTGYDRIYPEASLENHFSTVAIDFEKMGRKAIKSLIGEKAYNPKIMRLTPQLILRKQQESENENGEKI